MLTVKEAAAKIGVSESLVYSWCQLGVLPHYRAGRPGKRGKLLIDPDELAGFVAGLKSKLPEAPPQALAHVKMKARHG